MRPDRTRGISAAPGTPSVPLKFGRLKALLAAGQRKWLPRACCCWPAFLGVSGAYPGRWLPTAPGIRARWHGRLFGISGPGGLRWGLTSSSEQGAGLIASPEQQSQRCSWLPAGTRPTKQVGPPASVSTRGKKA